MKLFLKNSESNKNISIIKKEKPCLDSSWHYHQQYELLYISRSTGIRYVGDNVSHFSPGDLVLVGSYLPHLWRNDVHYYKDKQDSKVKTIVSKFNKDFIGKDTFDNPCFAQIKKMLDNSKYGISFGRKVSKELHNEIIGLSEHTISKQCIKLLEILDKLSLSYDKNVLSSSDMRQFTSTNTDKIDLILKYISDNYANNITLTEISNVACMTSNSFCRFFKKTTNKSFIQFLNEVRIRQACRLLIQEDVHISEACYKVGYNSTTNFHKQFKLIVGCTPKNYKETI